MERISVYPVRALMKLANAMPLDALTAGLSFDARSIRRQSTVPWDDYCTLLERVEIAAGGPRAFEDLTACSLYASWPMWIRKLLGSIANPRAFMRFMVVYATPPMFPQQNVTFEDLPDGRFRLTQRIRESARPSFTVSRSFVASVRGCTGHIGLPMAEVEVVDLTERSVVLRVRLPTRRDAARDEGESTGVMLHAALKLLDRLAAPWADDPDEEQPGPEPLWPSKDAAALPDAFPSLGASLGALLARLGWERMELAVLEADERAYEVAYCIGGEGSLTHFPLITPRGEVGRLGVAGARGDPALMAELLPWISVGVEHARTVQLKLRAEGPPAADRTVDGRLARVCAERGLTERQSQVLALLVRGLSNKQIAAVLDCADGTVELHVTQVLKKTAVDGRTQLIARFWADALSEHTRGT